LGARAFRKENAMNSSNDSRNPQAGADSQQPRQQGIAPQQQGSRNLSSSQQDQYSPASSQPGQHGGALSRRGTGGLPAMWGRGGPFELMRRLDEDMDRLFNQLWSGGRNLMRRGSDAPGMWMPQVEMCERGGKLHVFADLPGMNKEDVKLSLDGDQLVIQGERRASHEEGDPQQGGFFHSERSYGSFYRSIPLPEGVDPASVDASFKDGVLDVCFDAPKQQQPKSRQVQIRDGGSAMAGPNASAAQAQPQSQGGGSQQ
jgi:HSP20 family protein